MEYQIERLHKFLGEKVRGVPLGGAYEVQDPFTHIMEKKPLKPFLVNQLNMLLERGQLRIPNRDVDETIVRQMTNYVVERVSYKTGEPTYTNKDEHALDGLMFCLFAFIEKMPDLIKTIDSVKVATKSYFTEVKHSDPLASIKYSGFSSEETKYKEYVEKWDEPGPPPPIKTSIAYKKEARQQRAWKRGSTGGLPSRKSW